MAKERWESVIRQMSKTQGVAEHRKAKHQMLWVGKMNNIRACANEIVQDELIYN